MHYFLFLPQCPYKFYKWTLKAMVHSKDFCEGVKCWARSLFVMWSTCSCMVADLVLLPPQNGSCTPQDQTADLYGSTSRLTILFPSTRQPSAILGAETLQHDLTQGSWLLIIIFVPKRNRLSHSFLAFTDTFLLILLLSTKPACWNCDWNCCHRAVQITYFR